MILSKILFFISLRIISNQVFEVVILNVDVVGCVVTSHFVLLAEDCMSSGGSNVSLMKSHKLTQEPCKSKSLEAKEVAIPNNKNITKAEIEIKAIDHQLSHKSSAFESPNQLHHYARNLVMVQR